MNLHGCLFDPRGGQRLAGCQTLEGSFSAVWTATIARKDAFCRDFQDLQDLAFLCTAPNSNLQSFAQLIFAIFFVILQNFAEFLFRSVTFRRDFHRFLPELR